MSKQLEPQIQARIDLAAAFRWADRHGLSEGICNHFSYALPANSGEFLINPEGRHWREITASHLVVIGPEAFCRLAFARRDWR